MRLTVTNHGGGTAPTAEADLPQLDGSAGGGWRQIRRHAKAHLRFRYSPTVALIAVLIIFSALSPENFATSFNAKTLLQQAVVLCILAVGEAFPILLGSIDLSVGSLMGLSAAVSAGVIGAGSGLAIVAGIAIGVAAGLVNGVVHVRLRLPSFIVTLAMMGILRGVTIVYLNSQPLPIPVASVIGAMGILPGIVIVGVVCVIVTDHISERTGLGYHLKAIGGAERAAELVGVNVRATKILAFVISGAAAGVAGIVLASRTGVASPQLGDGYELQAISAVVLGAIPLTGGIGRVRNSVLGALIMTVLTNGLIILGISAEVQEIIIGVILIAAVTASLERGKIGIIK